MPGVSSVLGIILAAGRSSRMGRPKALLPLPADGVSFVATAIRTLREGGVEDLAVVGRPGDSELRREVVRSVPSVALLENPASHLGQLSSLLVGIEYAEQIGAGSVMVLPVDIPLVRAATVAALLAASADRSQPIVRPRHCDRHGHPVLFAAAIFPELRTTDLSLGARAVLRRDPSRVIDVDVDDPGVLRDFDHPDDYRRLLAGE
jgi:molybdenum cofactor cytidylyltransferase